MSSTVHSCPSRQDNLQNAGLVDPVAHQHLVIAHAAGATERFAAETADRAQQASEFALWESILPPGPSAERTSLLAAFMEFRNQKRHAETLTEIQPLSNRQRLGGASSVSGSSTTPVLPPTPRPPPLRVTPNSLGANANPSELNPATQRPLVTTPRASTTNTARSFVPVPRAHNPTPGSIVLTQPRSSRPAHDNMVAASRRSSSSSSGSSSGSSSSRNFSRTSAPGTTIPPRAPTQQRPQGPTPQGGTRGASPTPPST
jgi:hypothetical protein